MTKEPGRPYGSYGAPVARRNGPIRVRGTTVFRLRWRGPRET